ncbi:MAG TPA: hypothetical protein VGH38_33390, partial [Bryobacteraceae bacterium]
ELPPFGRIHVETEDRVGPGGGVAKECQHPAEGANREHRGNRHPPAAVALDRNRIGRQIHPGLGVIDLDYGVTNVP